MICLIRMYGRARGWTYQANYDCTCNICYVTLLGLYLLALALIFYIETGNTCDYGFLYFDVVMTSIYTKQHNIFDCGVVLITFGNFLAKN